MSESPRRLTDHLTPPGLIVGAVSVIVTVFVIALGFGFDVGETLEVLVTGVLLAGVMGIAAGIAWAIGHLIDLLTEDASP